MDVPNTSGRALKPLKTSEDAETSERDSRSKEQTVQKWRNRDCARRAAQTTREREAM